MVLGSNESACCWSIPRPYSPAEVQRSSELAGELVLPPQHDPDAAFLHGGDAERRRSRVMVVVPPAEEDMDVPALVGAIEALRARG